MRTLILVVFSCFAAHATSEVTVECEHQYGFPDFSDKSPSQVANLKVAVLTRGDKYLLNISWAVSIDASIKYLTGTQLTISGEPVYLCEYQPNLAEAKLNESKLWFHYEVPTGCGKPLIQANHLPLPPLGSGSLSLHDAVNLPCITTTTPKPRNVTGKIPNYISEAEPTTSSWRADHVIVVIFGGLAGLLMLSTCYLIYKNSATFSKSLGFKTLTTPAVVPVPVLVVHSAENSAFQQAVLALAEFLQWHGGCSVAVDMWQQGKIAELGPMRWLVEQVEAADRVLIVCPQHAPPTSLSPSNNSFLRPSIPAATHDLYSLILNIVASHAKSSSGLAKFWVVRLGERQDRSSLPPQLKVCKTFCLMGGLNSLCKSLHSQRQDNKKILDVLFKPGISYNERTTVKLGEAVNKLIRHQPSISSEMEPLKSIISV
ncbi:uncharacterized protein LOC114859482 isoform X2 [Betta splendens]|uniref:Uncharacterized protein LOC114859482 isoform X2 n=1 Tax=Betta splendens TaxID=158456 RepID=A0A8M1HFU6_BETSP|nr:uncharacterized protein LOC114859482 isoform X2 [Betta splendens]